MGRIKTPGAIMAGAGKSTFDMPEQLALGQRLRQRRAVDLHQRPVATPRLVMQAVGKQLVADARLTEQQHRQLGLRQYRQLIEQLLQPAHTAIPMRMPIQVMRHEHDQHGEALEQLLSLTDRITPPPSACGTWRSLYSQLTTFHDDLREHIHLENEVLFARALNPVA